MPTGYTYSVQTGKITELKDYILSCAKSFGAFIHMKDDKISPEIKYKEIGEYYSRQLENTKASSKHLNYYQMKQSKNN